MQLSAMVGCTDLQQKTGVSLLSPKDFKQNKFFFLPDKIKWYLGREAYLHLHWSNFQFPISGIAYWTHNI